MIVYDLSCKVQPDMEHVCHKSWWGYPFVQMFATQDCSRCSSMSHKFTLSLVSCLPVSCLCTSVGRVNTLLVQTCHIMCGSPVTAQTRRGSLFDSSLWRSWWMLRFQVFLTMALLQCGTLWAVSATGKLFAFSRRHGFTTHAHTHTHTDAQHDFIICVQS